MTEIWKDIEGYEGHYKVSNFGQIISIDRKVSYRSSQKQVNERLIKFAVHKKTGYQMCTLVNNKIKKQVTVHRVVAKAFIPNPDNKPEVNHINGIKTDNRSKNLEWVTSRENSIHSFKMKLQVCEKGEDRYNSKLKSEQVFCIKYLLFDFTDKDLSKIFNVSASCIRLIRKNINWKHI